MTHLFIRFLQDEQGQDLIEYALLAGLISIGSILAINTLGSALRTRFGAVASSVTAAS